jgi:2-polyprenyl-6-methoxyphenol hydroxylase-like FAD-dependent oxidoreductase
LSACFPGAEPQARELSVRAFEKDATFAARHQGYGLTMQQGSAVLERLGLADAARAEDTPSEAHWVFEASGALLNAFSSKEFGRARAPSDSAHWERHRNLTIPRQRLRELLLDKLSKDHDPQLMQWGWQYAGHARCADGRVAVEFVRPAATARAATAEGAELRGVVAGAELRGVVAGAELRGVVAGAELRGVVAGAEPAAPQQPLERRAERRTVLARVLVGADGLWSAVPSAVPCSLASSWAPMGSGVP